MGANDLTAATVTQLNELKARVDALEKLVEELRQWKQQSSPTVCTSESPIPTEA